MNEARLKVGLVLAGAAIAWAIPFAFVRSGDFIAFLLPWWRHVIAEGPIGAFSRPFGNYAPPYLYLFAAVAQLPLPPLIAVKSLSAAGALWLAFAVYRLTGKAEAGAWSLLLPTVVFNVPFLGQADVFWLAPCVLAVAAATRGNAVRAALWASLGFAFKAQAVFIAPFVALVLIRRRAPPWVWAVPIPVYCLAVLPAWAAGWPLSDLFAIYIRQAQWHLPGEVFISTAPNLWLLVNLAARELYSIWVGLVLAAAAVLAYLVRLRSVPLNGPTLIAAAALSAAMLPFLLPAMHERFFGLAEILTFCLAWVDRRAALLAALAQIAFLLDVGGLYGGLPWLMAVGAAVEAAVIAGLVRRVAARLEAARPVPDAGEGQALVPATAPAHDQMPGYR